MRRDGAASRVVAVLTTIAATACASTNPTARPMEYLTAIIQPRPLTIHFSLLNPERASAPVYGPVMLEPLGAFLNVVVRDGMGEVVCQTHAPKFTPKLKPTSDDAYLAIEPGRSHGAVFVVDDCELAPGTYRVQVTYSNRDYRGTAARPVGELSYATVLSVSI